MFFMGNLENSSRECKFIDLELFFIEIDWKEDCVSNTPRNISFNQFQSKRIQGLTNLHAPRSPRNPPWNIYNFFDNKIIFPFKLGSFKNPI